MTTHPRPSVRRTEAPEGLSGAVLYEALDAQGAPVAGPRVALIARMHGNEPVGDGVFAQLDAEATARLQAGSVLVVRANVRAAALDLRHTPTGSDLNRLWDPASQARLRARDPATLSYEEQRALELYPHLAAADAVLDLHSTSRPSAPFLVMRDDQRHAALALKLGVERLITGVHENGILTGGAASNVGLAPGERGARLGFTFEAGQHSDPGNAARAWEVTQRLLGGLGMWRDAPPPPAGRAEVFEVTDRFRQATEGAEPFRFVGYEGGDPGAGRRGAPRKLHSFEEIEADEVVLRRGAEVVRAGGPFTMLMPAPTTPPDTDLYYVTQPRHGGLSHGVPRADADARREGLAIERMMDLLADDEFHRGSTWVAFDNRRLFDLCAEGIGRTLRLEEGHPHRRIVVLGRGDAGGDEAERRAGQRYRQAMRRAIARGLPIERLQILRGAPLAWLDTLTSQGMLDLMARRREGWGPDTGVRMRVSLRQPHTASLLVAGDLERALEEGETRHVRVALLIEAATVEPDGASARVRVVRSGLVSTRPEVLRAAASVLRAFRQEHRYLVRHGNLRDEPAVRALLQEDDALQAVAEREPMEALREALCRAQLRLWCDQLRVELEAPVRLPSGPDLGRWLARTMAATGILDAEALKSLAVRPDGAGWVADPEAVQQVYDRVHAPPGAPLPPIADPPPSPPSPPQPQFAEDLVADDLERWVGWKRFVREVQVIPDTRGKDLDLAFTGPEIRSLLARWFEAARDRARARPGEVMVVVAGDGLNPTRDRMSDTFALFRTHRAVVVDGAVQYLRIQNAQGTHLSWMKDFLHALRRRPEGAAPAALQFEVEHGATVNVVLVLERDPGSGPPPRPWSLDGWDVVRCGVVLSDLEGAGAEDYKVGLFTERPDGRADRVNQELLHFGRAHCEGLLVQAGARVRSDRGPLDTDRVEETLVHQIARWIERVRVWRTASHTVPRDLEARGRWVGRRLGLVDARLARALAREMERDTPPEIAARALWDSVPPWPGPAWNERADGGSPASASPPG